PSTGKPRSADFVYNIQTQFPRRTHNQSSRCGYSLSADGIAIERRMRWVKSIDSMVGACREHSAGLDMSMSSFDTVLEVARAMHSDTPTCHYGTDGTVFGMAPFRADNYHILPIGLSASCKAEKAEEFGDILDTSIDDWSIHGSDEYGDLWTFSCDGATTFRGACYDRLMVREFDRSSALYRKLSTLKGLNLRCGKRDVVHAPDPKHLIKRVATHVRSAEGSVLNGTVINRIVVTNFLRMLPGHTKASVDILVDPADHQNVPRATKLLQAVVELANMNPTDLSPTAMLTYQAICLQASLWQSLLDAFIDPSLSLSQQLTCLAKFAHMAFILYLQHGSTFMSNQLYSDIQALIKAVYVCVARQQLLDDTKPFYLYQIGSDRLEELFAEVRTQSHDRNCDMAQLAERLAISADIIQIYNRHPDWNRGQRRRSFTGREGVDHVNPRFYEGDMVVKNVCLETVWRSGLIAADKTLHTHGIQVNFDEKLSHPGVDFMKPRGDTYPGVSTDPDRSIVIDPDSTGSVPMSTGSVPIQPRMNANQSASESEFIDPDLVNMELSDLLSNPDTNGNIQTSQEKDSDWLHVPDDDGNDPKELHKASIVSGLFDPAGGRLSVDRLRRVRGFPRVFRANELESEELTGEDVVNVGDTVLAPLRSLDSVAAGFVQVKGIERKGNRVAQVTEADLEEASMDVKITGQVLSMSAPGTGEAGASPPPEPGPANEPATPSSDDTPGPPPGANEQWLWTGETVRFNPANAGAASRSAQKAEDGTRNALLVQVPGAFAQPVDMAIVPTTLLPPAQRTVLHDRGALHTCAVDHKTLQELTTSIFKTIEPSALLSRLPRYGPAELKRFPYLDRHGYSPFALDGVMRLIAQKNESGVTGNRVQCYQCNRIITPDLCRTHVSEHILRALLGITEPSLRERVHADYPCGFCGRTGCGISLQKTSSSYQPASSCSRAHKFSLASAKKHSGRMPSTNVPLHCELCDIDPHTKQKPVFWKYSIFQHIRESHPQHWDTETHRTQGLSEGFIASINVDPREVGAIAPSATRAYPIPDAEAEARLHQGAQATAGSKRPGEPSAAKRASKRVKF
ncbi:uncharacterized protein C8Q71DRAFT_698404, partial [Rhodofomes roseus]